MLSHAHGCSRWQWGRSLWVLLGMCVVLGLLLAAPSASVAQIVIPPPPDGDYIPPEWSLKKFDAVAGEGKTFSADVTDLRNCTNLRDVVLHWGDGTESNGTATSLGGTTNAWRLSGTHTYATAGDYAGAADVTATCTNNQGQATDLRQIGKIGGYPLGFTVHVTAAGSSCPLPGSAAAWISQTGEPCVPVPKCAEAKIDGDGCYYTADQKKLFRTLAKIAHDGYVVDKAIDDVISIPEDFITDKLTGKGLVTEFVVGKFWGKYVEDKLLPKIPSFGKLPSFKRVPYDAILDAAKYASWLDYSKYWVLSRLADDPPDPNFTSLAKPRALGGIPDAVPALGEAKAREVALYVALLATVERAAGAREAGDAAAVAEQLGHASSLSNRLVTLLGAQRRALKKAAKVVDKMPALRLPRGLVKRTARRLDAPASAAFERKAIAKLGFTAERIDAVGDAAPDVSINDLTKPFKKVLGLKAEAKVIARERAALAAFANKYAIVEP